MYAMLQAVQAVPHGCIMEGVTLKIKLQSVHVGSACLSSFRKMRLTFHGVELMAEGEFCEYGLQMCSGRGWGM